MQRALTLAFPIDNAEQPRSPRGGLLKRCRPQRHLLHFAGRDEGGSQSLPTLLRAGHVAPSRGGAWSARRGAPRWRLRGLQWCHPARFVPRRSDQDHVRWEGRVAGHLSGHLFSNACPVHNLEGLRPDQFPARPGQGPVRSAIEAGKDAGCISACGRDDGSAVPSAHARAAAVAHPSLATHHPWRGGRVRGDRTPVVPAARRLPRGPSDLTELPQARLHAWIARR